MATGTPTSFQNESDLVSISSLVQQLQTQVTTSHDYSRSLHSLLHHSNYGEYTSGLNNTEARALIELFDRILDLPPPDTDLCHKTQRALRRICGQTRVLPNSHMLSDGLKKIGDMAISKGTFTDVWSGDYKGRPVAIKMLRIYNNDDLIIVQKLLCKEVVIWKRLSHPNILPFMGVSETVFRLCMVSEWMMNGNINNYIKINPHVNRPQMLLDIANGLHYLHSSQVVHGNLKGHNVLIDDAGHARLADFGLASITSDPQSVNASTGGALHGSARWMAPELLNPDQESNRPTKASDVYGFAMVATEVFSGDVPFHELRNQSVLFKVIKGQRPARPPNSLQYGLTDEVWDVIQSCWHQKASHRPSMPDIISRLEPTITRNPREHKSGRPPPLSSNANDFLLQGTGSIPMNHGNNVGMKTSPHSERGRHPPLPTAGSNILGGAGGVPPRPVNRPPVRENIESKVTEISGAPDVSGLGFAVEERGSSNCRCVIQ